MKATKFFRNASFICIAVAVIGVALIGPPGICGPTGGLLGSAGYGAGEVIFFAYVIAIPSSVFMRIMLVDFQSAGYGQAFDYKTGRVMNSYS
ncbi:MAG: hypothetical protein P4L10_05785 [Acidobacteriaceae bacterium]|nr:hypothetical protein [Acidobacteriaceae bacterium]